MSRANFHDNLVPGSKTGHGLFVAVRDSARFLYERHDTYCRPGMWRVSMAADEWCGFRDALSPGYCHAVVDDFGTLVPVEVVQ